MMVVPAQLDDRAYDLAGNAGMMQRKPQKGLCEGGEGGAEVKEDHRCVVKLSGVEPVR